MTALLRTFSSRRSFCFSFVCRSCRQRAISRKEEQSTNLERGERNPRPSSDNSLNRIGRNRVARERSTSFERSSVVQILLLLQVAESSQQVGNGVVLNVGGGCEVVRSSSSLGFGFHLVEFLFVN